MGFHGGSAVKTRLPMQETQLWSLGQEDALEKEMTTHPNILAGVIPWTEEPGRLRSMGSQRVRHDLATKQQFWILKGNLSSWLGFHSVSNLSSYSMVSPCTTSFIHPFIHLFIQYLFFSYLSYIICFLSSRKTSISALLTMPKPFTV